MNNSKDNDAPDWAQHFKTYQEYLDYQENLKQEIADIELTHCNHCGQYIPDCMCDIEPDYDWMAEVYLGR